MARRRGPARGRRAVEPGRLCAAAGRRPRPRGPELSRRARRRPGHAFPKHFLQHFGQNALLPAGLIYPQ